MSELQSTSAHRAEFNDKAGDSARQVKRKRHNPYNTETSTVETIEIRTHRPEDSPGFRRMVRLTVSAQDGAALSPAHEDLQGIFMAQLAFGMKQEHMVALCIEVIGVVPFRVRNDREKKHPRAKNKLRSGVWFLDVRREDVDKILAFDKRLICHGNFKVAEWESKETLAKWFKDSTANLTGEEHKLRSKPVVIQRQNHRRNNARGPAAAAAAAGGEVSDEGVQVTPDLSTTTATSATPPFSDHDDGTCGTDTLLSTASATALEESGDGAESVDS